MDLLIIGAGGFAREVAKLVEDINQDFKKYNLIGFVDKESNKSEEMGYPILSEKDVNYDKAFAVIAIGNPKIISSIKRKHDIKSPNLIHPTVRLHKSTKIGNGNIICEGNIFTVNIQIGHNNILNLGNTIGHETIIGNYNVINPGCHISGNVKIGNENLIGTGAVILENLSVGDLNKIGAGAVVTKDVGSESVMVGVPAKKKE